MPRPHILASLEAGLSGKLTLISAPAGFGKTTLVSEWVRACGHPTAWLSLDKNDNDPSRFLIYLIAALQQIHSKIGIDAQAVLEGTQSPQFEILLTRLISEIDRLPEKSILVLDDYHLIDEIQIHDVINFLVEYLPATIHLVISGRTDPPLPISRLRVRGEVNEVRTSQLRFTKQEVATYLKDRMGFDLSSDDIAALEARTEGWVASLKLAAISMGGREDLPKFITEFSGSNRYVIDYLVDEVMVRQPEEVKIFLRRTSILERFCASLCKYVVGSNLDLDIIDHLDRSNLFLIPLDDRKEWYRYHHLFADFLRQRLREYEQDKIPELHHRASQWYENEGLVDEAIQHALASGDLEGATRLVDGIAVDLFVRAEWIKILKYIEPLPSDLLCQSYPMLSIWHAWALFFMGQLEMAEPILTRVESNQKKMPGFLNPGYVTTVRAYLANARGDFLKSIKLSEQALEEMSSAASVSSASPDRFMLMFQGAAVIWLGVNHRLLGNLDNARQLYKEAAEINQKANSFYAALSSIKHLADLEAIRGQLHLALDYYRSGLQLAQNWKGTGGKLQGSLVATVELQMGLGSALYQLNDLAGAATYIQRSADLYELSEHFGRMHAYTMLSYLKQAQGEFESAVELLRKACAIEDTLVIRRSYSPDRPSMAKLGILLSHGEPEMTHLLKNAILQVEKWGISANDEVDFTSPRNFSRELIYSDLACLLIAQNRAAEALPLLARLLAAATTMKRHGDEIRFLVMTATAQHALANTQAALDSLRQALTLAEPEGYIRVFVDEGFPMAELLSLASTRHIRTDYVRELLAAFPDDVLNAVRTRQASSAIKPTLNESLSQREIDVLHLMIEGYKYKEIAEKLVVSINTVRHHTRNIYGKLDANNRTQAIEKAKELNLL